MDENSADPQFGSITRSNVGLELENKRRERPPASLNSFNWVTAEPTSSVKSGTYELYTSNRRPVTEQEIHIALQSAQEACTNEWLAKLATLLFATIEELHVDGNISLLTITSRSLMCVCVCF